jgi:hypothetical protein
MWRELAPDLEIVADLGIRPATDGSDSRERTGGRASPYWAYEPVVGTGSRRCGGPNEERSMHRYIKRSLLAAVASVFIAAGAAPASGQVTGRDDRVVSVRSNVMKAQHDTLKAAVQNMR